MMFLRLVILTWATLGLAMPCLAQSALDRADALSGVTDAPAMTPAPTPAPGAGTVSLLNVSSQQQHQGAAPPSMGWYEASSPGGQALPLSRAEEARAAEVPAPRRPWSGSDWKMMECGLAFASSTSYVKPHGLSPLEAYDTYVYNLTGKNPQAAFQEALPLPIGVGLGSRAHGHNMAPDYLYPTGEPTRTAWRQHLEWSGHCNGWADAACLLPEPPDKLVVKLPRPLRTVKLVSRHAAEFTYTNGAAPEPYVIEEATTDELVLSHADLIGIFCEAGLGMKMPGDSRAATGLPFGGTDSGSWGFSDAFRMGTRMDYAIPRTYRGVERPLDMAEWDWLTPLPHNMHLLLLNSVLERGQPVIADVDADRRVDNMPIYGYAYRRKLVEQQGKRWYEFVATVRAADYSRDLMKQGTTPLDLPVSFRIHLDAENRVTGSEWTGASADPRNVRAHPDFFWFPAPFVAGTNLCNPRLDDAVVRELLARYATPP